MVIEIPGCKFRIKGSGTDWQVQFPVKERKDGSGDGFAGRYYYPTLDSAIAKCYELALRCSDAKVELKGAADECRKVKEELVMAAREAVGTRTHAADTVRGLP